MGETPTGNEVRAPRFRRLRIGRSVPGLTTQVQGGEALQLANRVFQAQRREQRASTQAQASQTAGQCSQGRQVVVFQPAAALQAEIGKMLPLSQVSKVLPVHLSSPSPAAVQVQPCRTMTEELQLERGEGLLPLEQP
jgi:hypothetical protein